jgi:hypothetical protein
VGQQPGRDGSVRRERRAAPATAHEDYVYAPRGVPRRRVLQGRACGRGQAGYAAIDLQDRSAGAWTEMRFEEDVIALDVSVAQNSGRDAACVRLGFFFFFFRWTGLT